LVASSKKLYDTQKKCADAIGTTPYKIKNACNRGGGIITNTTFFVMYDSDNIEPGAMREALAEHEFDDDLENFSVASSDASATDMEGWSSDSDGSSVASVDDFDYKTLRPCPCGCGMYIEEGDGDGVRNERAVEKIGGPRMLLHPAMIPGAEIPAGYDEDLEVMREGDWEALARLYNTPRWLQWQFGPANRYDARVVDAATRIQAFIRRRAQAEKILAYVRAQQPQEPAEEPAGEEEVASGGASTGGGDSPAGIERILVDLEKELSGLTMKKVDGEVIDICNLPSSSLISSIAAGNTSQAREAARAIMSLTAPAHVGMLYLMMTPYFHRLTKWYVQHAHARPEFATYQELKSQFDEVMDSVEKDIDRVSFSEAFSLSEKGWNSITASSRRERAGKTYTRLMVRWARSPAFGGRGESFADYPVSKLGAIANLDHMTNPPGEAKSGRSVTTVAYAGQYPEVIVEAIQTEAVLIFDNASGSQNIAKFQLQREASRYEKEEGLVDDAGEAGDSAADEVNKEISDDSDDSGNSGFMEESPPRQGSKRSSAVRTPASGRRSSKRRGSAQS